MEPSGLCVAANALHSSSSSTTWNATVLTATSSFADLQALSDQVSSGLGLYTELEAERATNASLHEIIATLEQRLVNHEALEKAMELQTQRLKEDLLSEQEMNKKLAEQLQQATEVRWVTQVVRHPDDMWEASVPAVVGQSACPSVGQSACPSVGQSACPAALFVVCAT